MPTFVVEAGHGGSWEYIPPGARIHRRPRRSTSAPTARPGTRTTPTRCASACGATCAGPAHRADSRPRASTRSRSCFATTTRRASTITVPGGHVRGHDRAAARRHGRGRRRVRADARRWTAAGSSAARSARPSPPPSVRNATSSAGCHARSTRRHGSRSTRGRSATARTCCSRERRTSRATLAAPRPRSSSTTGRRAPARSGSRALPRSPRRLPPSRAASTGRTSPTATAGSAATRAGRLQRDRRRGRAHLRVAAWRRRAPHPGRRQRVRRRRPRARRLRAERARQRTGHRPERWLRGHAAGGRAARPADRLARARAPARAHDDRAVADARAHPGPLDRPGGERAGSHAGADARARRRRPLAPDHRCPHPARRPPDHVHQDRPLAPRPAGLRPHVGDPAPARPSHRPAAHPPRGCDDARDAGGCSAAACPRPGCACACSPGAA